MLRSIKIAVLAAAVCWGVTGCGQGAEQSFDSGTSVTLQKETAVVPEVSTPQPDEAAPEEETEPFNNGGGYVKLGEAVYYWKYGKDSFEKQALFGRFGPAGGDSQLVKRLEDGTETVIYQGSGYGRIWISGNRFYLTGTARDANDYYEPNIYSIDMEGKGRKDYGQGSILDISEENGVLICMSADYRETLFTVDCESGNRKDLCENAVYLGSESGNIYYEDCNEAGSLTIKRAAADTGQSDTILYIPGYALQNGLEEYSSISTSRILTSQILDGYLYFNYGYIAGTAMMYQDGVIARVGLDGAGYQILMGVDTPKRETLYVSADETGAITVYTDDYGDGSTEISLDDMKIQPAGEKKASLGVIRTENSIAYFYPNADNKKIEIMTDSRLDSMDEAYFNIRDAQIVGESLYFVTEYSTHKPEEDIGWRYCYERQETILYRRPLGGGEPEELYRY